MLRDLILQSRDFQSLNGGLPLEKTVVSMLSCGALERSKNSHIESIVEPCFSKNQKGIFAMWG